MNPKPHLNRRRSLIGAVAILLVFISLGLAPSGVGRPAGTMAAPLSDVQTPVLKWQRGGCYATWCETGWYSSPAVADLDGDGTWEVVGAAYTLFVLNGEDGSEQWHVPPPVANARAWPGVVVADVDGDADLEIITAHGYGYVRVLDQAGNLVWIERPASNELRGLAAFDLDGDGTLEIIVTGAVYDRVNTWVYEHDGTLRSGWPQLSDDSGYAYGVFNDNAAVGDVDGDGTGEIVVPSDVHYICAYEPNGVQIPANSMYGDKGWGEVGVWESLDIELRGWGACSGARAERYRTNFAHGPAVIGDVDGDGASEVVATGNVYDCAVGHPPGKYNGVYIFNADRSRFNQGGYDWQDPPVDPGAPLSEDWNEIESNQPNPALADLDGDGEQEIIYASYDGRVHAFWLDKTEHGNWPTSIYSVADGFYRFASEPVVADLDDDGLAEVIFASWTQKGSEHTGRLHILDYLGNPLQEVELPDAVGDWDWNGALAAPTLANIDADADLEVVLNTAHSGLVAYDLPGTAGARVLWGTGRGNYQRTGSLLQGTLQPSTKQVTPTAPRSGDVLTYTITLRNPGPVLSGVRVTDTLPAEVYYLGDLWASTGSYDQAGGVITWTGSVSTGTPVTITFGVTISQHITTPYIILNTALLDDGLGNVLHREAVALANGYTVYLPLIPKR
jgi:uncharacterized repeat protein (TIGR01451 family)